MIVNPALLFFFEHGSNVLLKKHEQSNIFGFFSKMAGEVLLSDLSSPSLEEKWNRRDGSTRLSPCELQPVAELFHLLHHLHTVGLIVRKVVPGLWSKWSQVKKVERWPAQRGRRLRGQNLAGSPEFLPLFLDGLLLDLLLLLSLLRCLFGLLLFLLLQQASSFQLRLPGLQRAANRVWKHEAILFWFVETHNQCKPRQKTQHCN